MYLLILTNFTEIYLNLLYNKLLENFNYNLLV